MFGLKVQFSGNFFESYKLCRSRLEQIVAGVLDEDKSRCPHLKKACENLKTELEKLDPNEGSLKKLLFLIKGEANLAKKDVQFIGKTGGETFASELEALCRDYLPMISPLSEHQEAEYVRFRAAHELLVEQFGFLQNNVEELVLENKQLQAEILKLTKEQGERDREYGEKAFRAIDGVSIQLNQLMIGSGHPALTSGEEKSPSIIELTDDKSDLDDEIKKHKESFKKGMSAKRYAVIKVLSNFIPVPENLTRETNLKLKPKFKLGILPTESRELQQDAKILCKALLNDTVYLSGKSTQAIMDEFSGEKLKQCLQSTLERDDLTDTIVNKEDLKTPLLAFRTNRFLQYTKEKKDFLVFYDEEQYEDFYNLYKTQVPQQQQRMSNS